MRTAPNPSNQNNFTTTFLALGVERVGEQQTEASEDIQVVIADREECRRILREENVAIMCAYMLMHFIASEGDPLAFLDKI